MKAPDKIFVCIPQRLNMPTFKEDSKYVGMAYTDRGNLTSPQIEEYVSKKVLLDWANRILNCNISSAMRIAVRALISKINSL